MRGRATAPAMRAPAPTPLARSRYLWRLSFLCLRRPMLSSRRVLLVLIDGLVDTPPGSPSKRLTFGDVEGVNSGESEEDDISTPPFPRGANVDFDKALSELNAATAGVQAEERLAYVTRAAAAGVSQLAALEGRIDWMTCPQT